MIIVKARAEFEGPVDWKRVLEVIESAGRVCYKSEDKITDGSAESFVRRLIRSGHESVLEHAVLRARIVCDRGVSHELVRHRLASYSQESTRYCNYSQDKFGGEIAFVLPPWVSVPAQGKGDYIWVRSMQAAEDDYFALLDLGWSPQQARSVLPNSLKTELVMTANVREWRHFLRLRCAAAAHPQMREVACQLRDQMAAGAPVLAEDLMEEGTDEND